MPETLEKLRAQIEERFPKGFSHFYSSPLESILNSFLAKNHPPDPGPAGGHIRPHDCDISAFKRRGDTSPQRISSHSRDESMLQRTEMHVPSGQRAAGSETIGDMPDLTVFVVPSDIMPYHSGRPAWSSRPGYR